MPEFSALAVFITAALVLVIIPGPSVLYIIARCIDQGRLAGLVSILGISVGTLFHIAAAALGLSALLMSSALAFNVIKYLGAAYLIYLGMHKLLVEEEITEPTLGDLESLRRIFVQGVFVNLLNPKTAIFFFAFLPQFVDVERGSVAHQVVILGLIFIALAVLSDAMWAFLADSVGSWLKSNMKVLKAQRYFSGGVYLSLGVATALYGSHRDP